MDSLGAQSGLAVEFMSRAWPEARDSARAVVGPKAAQIEEVILCGCGDSHHAAAASEMAFSEWSGRRVRAAPAMAAARYLVPRLGASTGAVLLIGISVSGEVARTIEAVDLASAAGASTLALTADSDSSLVKAAHMNLALQPPAVPTGPGLLSFLGSLLLCYAVAETLSGESMRQSIDASLNETFALLEPWIEEERRIGEEFAEKVHGAAPVLFLGSGPAHGMAMFAAAKLVEAAGVCAWAQDVEEWAHVEYFAAPANAPTWLLSSAGRSQSREDEIAAAASAIGRSWAVSRWLGDPRWPGSMREVLSPLALWPGPVSYASCRASQLGEKPFRDFGGGRSAREGGGVSRIRSSLRWRDVGDV